MSSLLILEGPHCTLRPLQPSDQEAFLAAGERSRALHGAWFRCADTAEAFQGQLDRGGGSRLPLLLVHRDSGEPAGIFNLSQIARGNFLSAYLGYAAFVPHAGRGRMSEGLELLLRLAFGPLELHRVEANIQPGNAASMALARRSGFVKEGFSPAYLFLDGAWRDHERWAIRSEIFTPRLT